MPKHIIFLTVGFCLFNFFCSGSEKSNLAPPARVVIQSQDKEVLVLVELAKTREQKERGLMFRQELEENRGMLFIEPYPKLLQFWMKDTYIPLDLIFIGEDMKIKGIIKNAKPQSTESLAIDRLSRFVLEVNAGFADKHNVKEGDAVKFLGFTVE